MEETKSVTFKFKDGVLSIDAAGFKGVGCGAIAEAARVMGTEVQSNLKPEFYEEGSNNNNLLTVSL